jgi:outer membrane murein-binding lipoprotein Lpp
MTDVNNSLDETQVSQETGQHPSAAVPTDPMRPSKPARQRGGWFRRIFFIFLMLVAVAGLALVAALLRMRLDTVLSDVDSLNAEVEDIQVELDQTQDELEQTQIELANTHQALENLAEANAAARAELEVRLRYYVLLVQAQEESSKAILSIIEDDLGQTRRELTALRATLVAASGLASEEDIATLADLEQRAANAESDLNANSFASQQTLEVIWRDLNELSATVSNEIVR